MLRPSTRNAERVLAEEAARYRVGDAVVEVAATGDVHGYLGRFFARNEGERSADLSLRASATPQGSVVEARRHGRAVTAIVDRHAPHVHIRKVVRAWWVACSGDVDWLLHASAFARGGDTYLLAGGRRRGKTTLLFDAVLRAGHRGLANDAVAVRRGFVANVPSLVRVRTATLDTLAARADLSRLAPHHAHAEAEPGLRYVYEAAVLDEAASWTPAPTAVAALPRWVGGDDRVPQGRRLARADAATTLLDEHESWALFDQIAAAAAPLGGASAVDLRRNAAAGLRRLLDEVVDVVDLVHDGSVAPLVASAERAR